MFEFLRRVAKLRKQCAAAAERVKDNKTIFRLTKKPQAETVPNRGSPKIMS
jgi:hypothetical protein